jgi:hypothetical protein
MTDFPRPPKIVQSNPYALHMVYLDSPLGYEPQGGFDTRAEADEYIESLREHPEDVPSLWNVR